MTAGLGYRDASRGISRERDVGSRIVAATLHV